MNNNNLPTLYVMVGLMGSGKSTVAQEISEKYNANIHSSDDIRVEICGDVNNQKRNKEVFALLHNRIKNDLKNGKSTIYDATNISYKRRMAFIQELENIPCYKICVFVATPYEECLERNRNRDRMVPEEVIKRVYMSFDVPAFFEGWDEIRTIYFKERKPVVDFLNAVLDYDQNNKHHSLTLGQHCLKCASEVEKLTSEKLLFDVALLHDCGKPFCRVDKENGSHFCNHERVGAYESLSYQTDSPLDTAFLIRWHMLPYELERNPESAQNYIKLFGEELFDRIILFHQADRAAH